MSRAPSASVHVGVRTRSLSRERLRYVRQLGATDIFVDHADTDEEPDECNDREGSETIAVGPEQIPSVLHESEFDGTVIPGHVPKMKGDDDWRHRVRAHRRLFPRLIDTVRSEPTLARE